MIAIIIGFVLGILTVIGYRELKERKKYKNLYKYLES